MRSLPNMDVISPCDKFETEAVTRMITKSSNPTYLRLGKAGEPTLHECQPSVSYGSFIHLSRGDAGYIFFTGSVGDVALEANRKLQENSIRVEILSIRFFSRRGLSP
jgi:transketolase